MTAAAFLLDTNVVSELMRPEPDRRVLEWFAGKDPSCLFLTAVTEAELRTGVACLPRGRRRAALAAAVDAMIEEDFADRILPFDGSAARAYATIAAARRAAGRPIAGADCQIAAIALVHGAAVVTRNRGDFEGCGVPLIDPWVSPAHS